MWSFVDGAPLQSGRMSMSDVPASTPASDRMSKDLKRRGFRFVGTTICYAYMQACGMVNDHVATCFRHDECAALG
jgi:DNA-3-methyladenine glycosylase I